MLPKKERFTTADFSKIRTHKFKKIYTPYGFFVVYPAYSEATEGMATTHQSGKKGIVMSKKNFKRAVDRNKYKRLFYNTILEVQETKPETKTKSFVFHPKKVFAKEELKQFLETI